jgi:hypothetical protein
MKRGTLTVVSMGLAWLVSLGGVFLLGMLLAFAVHLGPDAAPSADGLGLRERHLRVVMEELTGQPADMADLMAVGDTEEVGPQLEDALRAILRLRSPEEQLVAAYRMVSSLPERRLLGSIRFLRDLGADPARDRVLGKFLEAWGGLDGRSAILFSSKLPGSERAQATAAVVRGWSRQEPVEAWNWVMEREPNARLAQRWVAIILQDQAHLNRALAMDLLDSLEPGPFQNRMGLLIFEQILETELPDSALAWLGQLPREVDSAAYGRVALAMARTNPEAAVTWLRETSPSDEASLIDILSDWGAARPEAAVAWAWANLEGVPLTLAMDALAEVWLEVAGPSPLAEWLNIHGPGRALDGAIEALAMATLEVDPATALVWAQSVSAREDRILLELLIGRQWLQRAPENAAETLPLLLQSPEAKAALLGDLEP